MTRSEFIVRLRNGLVGLPTATAHRALATLEESGYVARYQASARYVMGPMVPGLM